MKITKSELKEMIREALREELGQYKKHKLKETAPGWREYEITYSFDEDPTETYTAIMAAKIEEDEDKIIDRFFDSLFDSGYDEDVNGVVDVIDIKPL
jgi:predicted DsbA family dithiol-disulfide isomerase